MLRTCTLWALALLDSFSAIFSYFWGFDKCRERHKKSEREAETETEAEAEQEQCKSAQFDSLIAL